MCFNIALIKGKNELIKRYNLTNLKESLPGRIEVYNISGFSRPPWPVILQETPDQITTAQWGLIPHWVKDEKQALDISLKTLNARSETVTQKPSFKFSVKSRRCLIPVSGFYEPHYYRDKCYPFYMTHSQSEIFSLAGLTASWQGVITFTILTTQANSLLSKVHNKKKRMPVAFFSSKEEKKWLNTELTSSEFNKMVAKPEYSDLTGWPVSQFYGKGNTNMPQATKRYDYGLPQVDGLVYQIT